MADRVPLRDYSRSRAVVMGTWDYAHLPSVPAAGNSLERMVGLLTGPLCDWPQGRVLVVANERNPGDLPDRLITAFEDIADIALFYYVGHGQIDMEDQLCLSLASSRTEANRRSSTSLPFQAVRRALLDSKAATKIVILDCCFAGLANRPANTLAALADGVLDRTAGAGAYTMAASGAYSTAWFQADSDVARPETFFTKYFADLVEAGIPGEGPGLKLHPLFTHVRESLAQHRRPIPCERSVDAARDFVFAHNVAPAETQPDPDEELRLLSERLAETEASRDRERARAEAREQALRAQAARLTQELERLKDQARQRPPVLPARQRELQNAIDETGRMLDETTAAQAAAAERAHPAAVKSPGMSRPRSRAFYFARQRTTVAWAWRWFSLAVLVTFAAVVVAILNFFNVIGGGPHGGAAREQMEIVGYLLAALSAAMFVLVARVLYNSGEFRWRWSASVAGFVPAVAIVHFSIHGWLGWFISIVLSLAVIGSSCMSITYNMPSRSRFMSRVSLNPASINFAFADGGMISIPWTEIQVITEEDNGVSAQVTPGVVSSTFISDRLRYDVGEQRLHLFDRDHFPQFERTLAAIDEFSDGRVSWRRSKTKRSWPGAEPTNPS